MFTVLEDESNPSDRYGGDSVTFFPICSFGFQPFSQPILSFYGFLDVEGKECNLRNAKERGKWTLDFGVYLYEFYLDFIKLIDLQAILLNHL